MADSVAQVERELDELREDPNAIHHPLDHLQSIPADLPQPGGAGVPPKRGRGRPKGSKNKKTIEAEQTGGQPGTSLQQGEKRKRGRPPKVPYHLQFTDPTIIHDAIQSQAAQAESAAKQLPPKKRGRPPKNPKKGPEGLVAGSAAAPGGDDDEEGNATKRMKSVEGE